VLPPNVEADFAFGMSKRDYPQEHRPFMSGRWEISSRKMWRRERRERDSYLPWGRRTNAYTGSVCRLARLHSMIG